MPMDSRKIEELLNRYWNCESSLEEEQQLREYFRAGKYPDQLKDTAALFTYFDVHKKKSIDDETFDAQVVGKIQSAPKGRMASLLQNSMRIAAGIAVLVVAFVLVKNEIRKTTPQQVVDTYDDPKLAFEETKKALMMISKSFGTAEQEARKINMFNEAREEIQKRPLNEQKL
jgi:hypothetical protein